MFVLERSLFTPIGKRAFSLLDSIGYTSLFEELFIKDASDCFELLSHLLNLGLVVLEIGLLHQLDPVYYLLVYFLNKGLGTSMKVFSLL